MHEGNGWKVEFETEPVTIKLGGGDANKFTRFGSMKFHIPNPDGQDAMLSIRINDVDDLETVAAKLRAGGAKLDRLAKKLAKASE